MRPRNVQVTFETEQEAKTAYGAGLRHGLVTTPMPTPPDEGTPCRVSLTLAWAKRTFPMLGSVVHASPVATVIRIEQLPEELHTLIASDESTPPPSPVESPTLISEDPPTDGENELTSTLSLDDLPAVERVDPVPEKKPTVSPWVKRLEAASRSRTKARAARARKKSPEPVREAPQPTEGSESGSPSGIPVPFKPGRFLPGVALYEGTLPRHSLYQAFLQVHVTRLTGVGVIQSQRARYWSFFLHGRPVQFLREPPLENASIEALLIRRKLLSEAVLDRTRWLAEITARPLVSVVMRLKLITPEQLHTLRQEQTELVIKRVLGIRAGTYWFYEMPEIAEVFMDDTADAVALMWRRAQFEVAAMKPELATRKIAAVRGKVFERTPLGQQLLADVPLSEEQRAAVDRCIRTGWPVSDAVDKSGLSIEKATRLILTLSTLGLIACVEAAAEHREQAAAEKNLLHRHGRLHRDHFDFLEIHWSALPEEVEAACVRVDTMLEEATSAEDPIPGSDEMIVAARDRVSEIRSLFRDRRARVAYRADIVGVDKRRMAAELYLKQGEMAMFKHDTKAARECFQRLLELDPGGAGSAERKDRAHIALDTIAAGDLPGADRD